MLWKKVKVENRDDLSRFVERANELIDQGSAKFDFNDSKFGTGYETFCGLELSQTGIVRVAALEFLRIHLDGSYETNEWALNIPLRDCEYSITKFWRTEKKPEKRSHAGGYYWHVDGPYTLLGEFVLSSPTLLHIATPHSVTNYGPKDRYALSLRFKEPPTKFIDQ